MNNFDDVLKDLRRIAKREKQIYTLSQSKPNRIIEFSDNSIIVGTNKSPEGQDVKVEWIREVWEILRKKKRICVQDLEGKTVGRYRSYFILALLSRLPYVKTYKHRNKQFIELLR